jgi:hypothetical protein
MKYTILTIIFCTNLFTNLSAQKGPLVGSGKISTKSFEIENFDKLSIRDFDGSIEVEVGKPFSIKIEIDDNLAPLLSVIQDGENGLLNISLQNNKNGRLYLENTNIKIKVTMPKLIELAHRGNTSITVNGIFGQFFKFNNEGNGNAFLSGNVDELEIKKMGNGEVKANDLKCKKSDVKSYGNGNVLVNALISLSAFGAGNCSIIQFGNGKIDPLSGIVGNGSVKKM